MLLSLMMLALIATTFACHHSKRLRLLRLESLLYRSKHAGRLKYRRVLLVALIAIHRTCDKVPSRVGTRDVPVVR